MVLAGHWSVVSSSEWFRVIPSDTVKHGGVRQSEKEETRRRRGVGEEEWGREGR